MILSDRIPDFTFIFEKDVFQNGDVLFDAVLKLGFKYVFWKDDFLSNEYRDFLSSSIFHGSLETAKKISDFINDYNVSFFDAEAYSGIVRLELHKIKIEEEYRFVVINGKIVSGSKYLGADRKPLEKIGSKNHPARKFAQKIIPSINLRDLCFVIDICKSEGEYKIVELNPFNGADLYNCDGIKIAKAIMDYIKNEYFLKCKSYPCWCHSGYQRKEYMYFYKKGKIIKGYYKEYSVFEPNPSFELKNLDKKQCKDFLELLSKINFLSWKIPDDYVLGEDGSAWELILKLPNKTLKDISVWENYPEDFSNLEKLFSDFFCEKTPKFM